MGKREDEYKTNPTLIKWQSDPEDQELFHKFERELIDWHESGKEPMTADQDLRYSMDLHEARLKKHEIKKIMRFKKAEDYVSNRGKTLPFDKYNQGMNISDVTVQSEYIRSTSGKKIYKKTKAGTLYQTIIHKPSGDNAGEQLYNCPNCGAVSKINDLLDGCPYCNTRFAMGDLFPKVFNSYHLVDPTGKDNINIEMAICMILCCIGFYVTMYIQIMLGEIEANLFSIWSVIASVIFGVIGGYVLCSFYKLGYLLFNAIITMPMLRRTIGSKRRANAAMKKVDPRLNFEYLEGKALSLVRSIIYAENESELVQYSGGKLDAKIKDIVDISYRGALGVSDYRIIPGTENSDPKIAVDVNVFANNLYDTGDKLACRKEIIKTTMVHKVGKEINPSFSITRINCKNCGGSFDATKQKCCPFCGNEYHIEDDDFVVTRLVVE